jgi:excisionase family DNA binding protein
MRPRHQTPTAPVRLTLNVPEAAEALGIGVRTLQKLIYSERLPAYREGRSVRVRIADLEAKVNGAA